jgi:protein SCO1/2
MTRRLAACCLVFALSGCGRSSSWHSIDIAGAMPRLAFHMQRASDGAEVTERDYRGTAVVLYFGYTNCPDICPATLSNLSNVVERLGAGGKNVRVLFVTVDPDRDTLPVLKAYVSAFAKQVDGLRGDDDALTALARRYRVAFGVEKGPPGHGYNVMHSDAVFFFDRDGRARLVATSTEDIDGIASDLKRLAG